MAASQPSHWPRLILTCLDQGFQSLRQPAMMGDHEEQRALHPWFPANTISWFASSITHLDENCGDRQVLET